MLIDGPYHSRSDADKALQNYGYTRTPVMSPIYVNKDNKKGCIAADGINGSTYVILVDMENK